MRHEATTGGYKGEPLGNPGSGKRNIMSEVTKLGRCVEQLNGPSEPGRKTPGKADSVHSCGMYMREHM